MTRNQRMDGRVEIICEHGVGHTTPASARKVAQHYDHPVETWLSHGCDGCCGRPDFFPKEDQ